MCSGDARTPRLPGLPCVPALHLRRPPHALHARSVSAVATASGGAAARATHHAHQQQRSAAASPVPFGGAIVASLGGNPKLIKGDSAHVVPVLLPGVSSLPFGASLECVRHSSAGDASAASAQHAAAGRELLDIFYILSGTGVVSEPDGTVRTLHSGDSLVTWHNSTRLRCGAAQVQAGGGGAVAAAAAAAAAGPHDEQLVALKFHFPASLLLSSAGAPSHSELQVLVDEWQAARDGGHLSHQEADAIMHDMQLRAHQAMSKLYQPYQQHDGHAEQPAQQQREAPPPQQPQPQWPHVVAAVVAVASILQRLLRHAPAPPGGVQPSDSQQQQQQWPHAVAVVVAVASFLQRLLGPALAPAGAGLGALRRALRGSSAAGQHAAAPPPVPHAPAPALAPAASSPPAPVQQQQRRPAMLPSSGSVLLQRAIEDFRAFRFPRQTNRLAFVFDPSELGLSVSFGVEVFEPGHHTPLHIHKTAHELFFVLAGEGVAFCGGQRFTVRAGDCVVFPPGAASCRTVLQQAGAEAGGGGTETRVVQQRGLLRWARLSMRVHMLRHPVAQAARAFVRCLPLPLPFPAGLPPRQAQAVRGVAGVGTKPRGWGVGCCSLSWPTCMLLLRTPWPSPASKIRSAVAPVLHTPHRDTRARACTHAPHTHAPACPHRNHPMPPATRPHACRQGPRH